MWEPHLVVRGCCVWHASVERVFGAGIWWCRGCVPPCVGAPVCGWCVCGVDLFRHTAILLTLLWGTSFHIAGVWSVGLILSLSHPSSHPIQTPWLCGACSGTSLALHKCRPPQPTHPHTPLSSPRAVTHLMCCFIPCWCVHTNGTVFCFLCAVLPLWCAALPTLPPLCVAVLCAVPCEEMSVLPCVHFGVSCAQTPTPSRLPRFVRPRAPAL